MKSDRYALLISGIVALVAVAGPSASAQITMTLAIRDEAGGIDSLRWGFHQGATSGLDRDLGEEEFPPAPPDFLFDARWVDPRGGKRLGQGSKADFRGPGAGRDTFLLRVQTSPDNYPVTITWMAPDDAIAAAELRYTDADGSIITYDMKTVQTFSYSATEAVSKFLIVMEVQQIPGIIPGINNRER